MHTDEGVEQMKVERMKAVGSRGWRTKTGGFRGLEKDN